MTYLVCKGPLVFRTCIRYPWFRDLNYEVVMSLIVQRIYVKTLLSGKGSLKSLIFRLLIRFIQNPYLKYSKIT